MTKNKLGSGSGSGQRKLMVERLEKRSMLAGNVFIDELQLSVGNLFITGDNRDNGVLISEIPDGNPNDSAHSYVIAGFDFGDSPVQLPGYFESGDTNIGGGVKVDGVSLRVVRGVTGVVKIDLKKGDDVLAVGNSVEDLVELARGCGFGIGLGSGSGGGSGSGSGSGSGPGSDQEIVAPPIHDDLLQVPLAMVINTGAGNDAVVVIAHIGTAFPITATGAGLYIDTGSGNDAVAVGNAEGFIFDDVINPNQQEPNGIIDSTMLELVVTTGGGNDLVCIDHAEISAGVAIVTGDGMDTVHGHEFGAAAVAINTGNNSDLVELEEFDIDVALSIVTLGGHDSVFADEFSVGQASGGGLVTVPTGGAVVVATGEGNDNVALTSFDATSVVIDTGGGNDGSAIERDVSPTSTAKPVIGAGPITVFDAEIFFDKNLNGQIDDGEPLGPLVMVLGSGNDNGRVDFVDALALTASLGAGRDRFDMDDLFIESNLVVDAGAGNDSVFLFDSTIGLITQFLMGLGNDSLDIFESGGGSEFATLICDGGPGKRDLFDSDLLKEGPGSSPINRNGQFRHDENGVPHIIITNFEIFLFDEIPVVLAKGKPRKGW